VYVKRFGAGVDFLQNHRIEQSKLVYFVLKSQFRKSSNIKSVSGDAFITALHLGFAYDEVRSLASSFALHPALF
jgi:hypothetical protein